MRFKRETSMQSKKSIMTALSDAVLQVMAVQTSHMINKGDIVEDTPCSKFVHGGTRGIYATVVTTLIMTYSTSRISNATSRSRSQKAQKAF